MRLRNVALVIAAWMTLLTGGYVLLGAGNDEQPRRPANPDQARTQPQDTAPAQTTPAQTEPAQTEPAQTDAPEPQTDSQPQTSSPDSPTEVAPSETYTPDELDRIREEDPDKYIEVTVDPQDRNPALARQIEREQNKHRAYNQLPYQSGGVSVDITGGRVGGKPELLVEHTGSRAAAKRKVRAFLQRHRDSVSEYHIRYHRGRS